MGLFPLNRVIIDELKDSNSYKIAIEKYIKIIASLKESSGFFKKALMFDGDSAEVLNEGDFDDFKIKNLFYDKKKDFTISFDENFHEFKKELPKPQLITNPERGKLYEFLSMEIIKREKNKILEYINLK